MPGVSFVYLDEYRDPRLLLEVGFGFALRLYDDVNMEAARRESSSG